MQQSFAVCILFDQYNLFFLFLMNDCMILCYVMNHPEDAQEKVSQDGDKADTESSKDLSEHALSSTFEQHLVPSPAFRSKFWF